MRYVLWVTVAGHLSDRIGRKRMYIIGCVFVAVFAFVYFAMLDTKVPALIFIAVALSGLPIMTMYGPEAALIAESFSPRLRYSGASLGYQLLRWIGWMHSPPCRRPKEGDALSASAPSTASLSHFSTYWWCRTTRPRTFPPLFRSLSAALAWSAGRLSIGIGGTLPAWTRASNSHRSSRVPT